MIRSLFLKLAAILLSIFSFVLLPAVVLAQFETVADAPPLEIPYIAQIVGVIVAVFGLVSAIVPDEKMPTIVKQIVNFLALNFGNAKNDPAQDKPAGS